jgi:hypothetical protein
MYLKVVPMPPSTTGLLAFFEVPTKSGKKLAPSPGLFPSTQWYRYSKSFVESDRKGRNRS